MLNHLDRLVLRTLMTAGLIVSGQTSAAQVPPGAQRPGSAYADPSPHKERFISVAEVRLQLLDWGGQGPLILLLPGFGSNAHIFDDLAPRLTDRFRVVALTIRGFLPSAAPDSGYTVDRIVEDVQAILDSLGVREAVLAGHSYSGAFLTAFAARHPDRVLALVYLDAAFDFAVSDSLVAMRPFKRPPPPADSSMAAWRDWARTYFWTPALEAQERSQRVPEPRATAQHRDEGTAALGADASAHMHPPVFSAVHAPALAICALAVANSEYPWLTPDSTRWKAAEQYVATVRRPFQRDQCKRFARGVSHEHTITLDGHHYIFLTRQADVVRGMRDFLLALPEVRHAN